MQRVLTPELSRAVGVGLNELLAAEAGMYYATEEEAIKAAKENAAKEGLVDFDGNNCDDCLGWDGESRRCDCGNRRVYWEVAKTPEGFYAYALAY